MSGPYFQGQTPNKCGCFYPDVTRVGDDVKRRKRICHCIIHGRFEIPLGVDTIREMNATGFDVCHPRVPTEKWRRKERKRIMGPERTPADKHTMSQQWWQETAEELAAKVRGYFTNRDGKVEIGEKLDGDRDLYMTASRLTTRVVQPGEK